MNIMAPEMHVAPQISLTATYFVRLPQTGLNAFVYTGLNAQKLYVDGRTDGWTKISGRPYSKSTCGANNIN